MSIILTICSRTFRYLDIRVKRNYGAHTDEVVIGIVVRIEQRIGGKITTVHKAQTEMRTVRVAIDTAGSKPKTCT